MTEPRKDDAKTKYLEALEKKRKNTNLSRDSRNIGKVHGSQSSGNAPKMFRRKSGSA